MSGVQAAMVLCVVLGCSKRSGIDMDVSFFKPPNIVTKKGSKCLEPSKKRRVEFLAAISREVGLVINI